ncbi:MAG: glutamyl-tRNA reductase [Elusimicrobia bacterium CG1_02_63_36]|nr:MAG: glutamyl-tRNA reductase [Elusimicrobia bacterium CG1_02_63_36]
MSVALFGINHRSAPVEIRETFAALGAACVRESLLVAGWKEAVVLSTCNRFEVYAVGNGPREHWGEHLSKALEKLSGVAVGAHRYLRTGSEAVAHLFSVASGLDSLVLGECEILSQIKKAYESAHASAATSKRTNVLFQRALLVGKAVRSSTHISMGQLSVASVAVELAKRIFGSLAGSDVLVLGAGETAEKTARHLISSKVSSLHISNRTWERARDLAAKLKADPVRWEAFPSLLAKADIVVSSTGASRPVLSAEVVKRALAQRGGRSLFLIDIAMPRDVSPDVDKINGVYLYRIEDLRAIADENASRRRGEIEAARSIIVRETDNFGAWLESLRVGPEISLRHSHLKPAPKVVAVCN